MPTNEEFGSFFRSKRKAICPVLREFCRRNGFDAANVSRMERGLSPPPQAPDLLEAYAKALKFKKKTPDWDRFFELAAVKTGRIPAEVLEDKHKLPGFFLQLRAEAEGHSGWVRARHLQEWADTLDARATLPRLIRRLIQATGKGSVHILKEFGSEEQTQRSGWDGVVEAAAGDVFVPEGISGWEMGTDKDARRKFESDLNKRSQDPLGLDTKAATFVFVTPRQCQWRQHQSNDKKALRTWKAIRVYDSVALEQWLERSPAVDAWLAERLGLKPAGVISFDQYWENLQALTSPSLQPDVFLALRQDRIKKLEQWLDEPPSNEGKESEQSTWLDDAPGAIVIESRSSAEALDFVVAFSRDAKRVDQFGARALIVEDRNAWRRLAANSEGGLLLVPHWSLEIEPELVAEAVRKGNRVLLPASQARREQVASLHLGRVLRYDLERALESSGIERQAAHKYAHDAGGSLTVLKRLLGRYPGTMQPEWSQPHESAQLVPIVLVGSWNEDSEGDREAVERIANCPYAKIAELVARWIATPDSPVRRVGSRISLVSRDDSWFFLAPRISSDDQKRFEQVALAVLSEGDPSVELPANRRWEASFKKKEMKYSPILRQGLAETLALFSARPIRPCTDTGTPPSIGEVVQKLLNKQDGVRWASLSNQLPLLAEAAPQIFLDAVKADLKRSSPALKRVFEQGGDPLFNWMPHTGVLWALDVLGWHPDFLPEASLALAALDVMTLHPQAGNTPFRSLTEIFMTWFPQTAASVEQRIDVLRLLNRRFPSLGWKLLLALLPGQIASATERHRPSWRNWALPWSRDVTPADYRRQVKACAEMLIDGMENDVGRWKDLIKRAEHLPRPAFKTFLDRLKTCAERVNNEDVRRDVCDTLREKVNLHRRFSTAKWAMPEETLSTFDDVRECFEPQDAVRKNAWLFGQRWRVLDRLENNDERMASLCRDAIATIVAQEGWDGILRLIDLVEAPEEVGATVGEMALASSDERILPDLLVSASEPAKARFAAGYALRRIRSVGQAWIDQLNLHTWSVEQAGRLLLLFKFDQETWRFVDSLGTDIASWYWQHTTGITFGKDKYLSEYVIRRFLEHRRASSALAELRLALHHKQVFAPALLMDILRSWLDFEVPHAKPHDIHAVKYDLDQVFQELQQAALASDTEVDIDRLAQLEWACLELLDGYPSRPVVLHKRMCEKAEFFVDVLGTCFRPKDAEPRGESELTDKERQAATNAYRLLMLWETVPGSIDAKRVDEKRLLAWVNQARTLAKQRGLLEICESRIGHIFAYAPSEEDGSWPCIPVRDALEEIGTEEAFDGFRVGIYNKRGTFSKSIHEGGAQEWLLAQKYRAFAEACKVDWPETAAALRQVAAGYEEDAQREDLTAEIE